MRGLVLAHERGDSERVLVANGYGIQAKRPRNHAVARCTRTLGISKRRAHVGTAQHRGVRTGKSLILSPSTRRVAAR